METQSFRFANSEFLLYGAISILVLIVLFWISLTIRKRKRKEIGDENVISKIISGASNSRIIISFILLSFGLLFIFIGMARPQFGSKLEEVKQEGVEIMIALDVSNSMNAEDIKPSRLERSKYAILKLINKLQGDRLGIIIFAGDAYVQLPLTSDYGAARMFLSNVNTNLVQKQGTAIGSAIALAQKSFSKDSKAGKALIIITDGENHENNALDEAKKAFANGINVYTIGMGLAEGAPIPIINRYGQKDYRKDKNGKTIITKLNERMLIQLSEIGKGIYVRASTSNTGLYKLYDEIHKLQKEKFETKKFAEYNEQFQYFFAIALFFLILEIFVLQRKAKRFENFNIFKMNFIKTTKNEEV